MAERRRFSLDEMPVCLTPIHTTETVNQSITLYDGELEFEQGTSAEPVKGALTFEWLPRPALKFSLNMPLDFFDRAMLNDTRIYMVQHNKISTAHVYSMSPRNVERRCEVQGMIEPVELGQDYRVNYIKFHLPNFADYHGGSRSQGGIAGIKRL